MLTVNLEKELLRQNAQILSKESSLLIQEYDRLGDDISNSEVLNRVGINSAVKQGKGVKVYQENMQKQLEQFDKSRVFHVSQIEKLCNKYYLKFLPTYLFKGSVDKELPNKISQFEIATGRVCKSERHGTSNCYIAAPSSSFNLQKKPKDPLFFYKINSEYYYLIHKWGNDLSIFNRCKSFLSKIKMWHIALFISFYINVYVYENIGKFILGNIFGVLLGALAILIFGLIYNVATDWILEPDEIFTCGIYRKNEYNSEFE